MGNAVRFVDSASFNLVLGIMLGVDKAIKACGENAGVTINDDYQVEINQFKYTLPYKFWKIKF